MLLRALRETKVGENAIGRFIWVELVARLRFECAIESRGQPAERKLTDLMRERVAPPPFDLTGLVQVGFVPLDGGDELVDSLAFERLSSDQFGHPARPLLHLHHRADLAAKLVGHRVIGLVDDEDVGNLHDSGFEHLNRIAAPGLQCHDRGLCELGDCNFTLTDSDRFDQHQIETKGVHQQHRIGGSTGEPAEMSAARHRTNEDRFVGKVFGETNPVAEQGAVREGRARIDGDDADALAARARIANETRRQRRFADAGRPGETDGGRAPGLRVEFAYEVAAAPGLRERDRARERTRISPLESAQKFHAANCGPQRKRTFPIRGYAGLALALILALLCAAPVAGETLVVPLTGKRVRDIQTDKLFHTLFHDFFLEDDATTYVQSGDIPAMWLRDSSAQTIPYIRFQTIYPILRARFAGVIERNARNILADPYANALEPDYRVWERKWEIDSLAWPVVLASVYWRSTQDRTVFTRDLHRALQTIVRTYRCEEQHRTCSHYSFAGRVYTNDAYNAGTGMIWGAFRPSDDAVEYRFNIPQNAFAVVALRDIEQLAVDGYADRNLARQAQALGERVQAGIERYGRAYNPTLHRWMYAYETDGFGRYNLMDDANIPNLTTLPYIDWCSSFDQTYLATRAFALSMDNPFFFSGRYAQGLGSPHTPYGFVWPLGIIGRALTATSSIEVATAITTLAETDGEAGLIHESFYPDGYWRYTRDEFGWANALGAELFFRSLAGMAATQFAWKGPILPFEQRSRTPTLVPFFTQIENEAEIAGTLGRLLHVTGGAMPPVIRGYDAGTAQSGS